MRSASSPFPGGHDAVEGTEDRNGEASVGQPVLPAAAHVDALAGALGVPFLQLADQGRQPRAGGVVLVDEATEAALQGGAVIPLHTGLDFVAFEAQGLELQGLSLVGLAQRNDVVQLAGLMGAHRRACTSRPVLPAEPLGGCWCCPGASAASAGRPPGSPRPAAALGRARPGAASTPAAPAHPRRARESRSRLPTLAGAGRTTRRVLGAPPWAGAPLRAAGPARFAGLRSRSGHNRSPRPRASTPRIRECWSPGAADGSDAAPLRRTPPRPGRFCRRRRVRSRRCRLWPFLPSAWAGSNPGAGPGNRRRTWGRCARRRRFGSLRARPPAAASRRNRWHRSPAGCPPEGASGALPAAAARRACPGAPRRRWPGSGLRQRAGS